MNKIKSLFSLVFITVLFLSCGEDDESDLDTYTCTCSYYNGTETVTEVYDVGPKPDIQSATEDCDAQAESLDSLGASSISCNVAKD